ncbi:hypothetical protein H3C66_04150 [Patescibacteria group bacterium]|nr:hypothetical protein [Patescibacteria group bacterium]
MGRGQQQYLGERPAQRRNNIAIMAGFLVTMLVGAGIFMTVPRPDGMSLLIAGGSGVVASVITRILA